MQACSSLFSECLVVHVILSPFLSNFPSSINFLQNNHQGSRKASTPMSFGRPGGFGDLIKPAPPQRGSFPLDHDGRSFASLLLSHWPVKSHLRKSQAILTSSTS